MTKKSLMVLVLAVVIAGGAFAQTAQNTVVVDIGPTIIGAAIGVLGDMAGGGEGLSSSGFGLAAQYERQILEKFSVAGRFAYLRGGVGIVDEGPPRAQAELVLSSFSIEGHARYYPRGRTFFLDGMLGYANMAVGISGEMSVTDEVTGQKKVEKASMNMSQGFFKYGAKLGWRICFGKDGGFTFEPALGWSGGVGLGDTIGKQLSKELGGEVGDFDTVFEMIKNYIFVGGPRVTLAFGYRF
jgi:hypothetical protein